MQLAPNDRRLTRVLYRPAHGAEWEEKSWQWAIAQIAERVQATRDASFEPTDSQGRTVNRTPAMAVLGGAVLSNEECYLLGKLARSLGLVAIEHQALAAESSAEAALEATLGSGAMPHSWTDLARAQCILVVGANPAENHPVAMQWIDAARRRGTKLIVVDPRLTRTAAVADLHVPLRPGTDIALFGAVVRILLERGWIDHPYLARNTDAEHVLADGRSVFETLREHFSRYTPERAADVCGVPPETIEQLAHWFGATHAEGQAGSLVLGRGCTQHAAGTQIVRTLAIVQLLLGNAGVPGGGVCPLVGSANARGATDFGLRSDRLPAHLPAPRPDDASLAHYRQRLASAADSAALVSLLRACWGESADAENDFRFDWLPRAEGPCGYRAMIEAMTSRELRGLLVFGHNPAVSGPDASRGRAALEQLDWLVVADLWETETAAFWKRPGADPARIGTEVFLLPAATVFEKEGSATNACRWAQWWPRAVAPAGDALADLEILDRLARALRERYSAGGVFPLPIVELAWDYGQPADARRVAQEISGRFLRNVVLPGQAGTFRRGEAVPAGELLRDDGATSAGNALYCGSYVGEENRMARRGPSPSGESASSPDAAEDWAWCWPGDRRMLFSQAATADRRAFDRLPQGRARFWTPELPGGPLPEHCEPAESPVPGLTIAGLSGGELPPGELPIVASVVGVGEHWGSGATSRNLPWLVELVPSGFVEIGCELAAQRGIAHGDEVTVRSARGAITLRAVVTPRLQPTAVAGRPVHHVALVSPFGYQGLATGPTANDLVASGGCPPAKAFLCAIEIRSP